VPVEAAALRAAEGVYRFADGATRTLRVVGDKLTAQRGGGPRATLTPIAADDFLYEDGFSRLRLERDAGGRVAGLRLFPNGDGDGEAGARIEAALQDAPATVQVPRAALERLAGAYANGGRTLTVSVEGSALKAQMAGQPELSLRATSPIRFDVEETGATLEFAAGDAPAAEVVIRQRGRELVLRRVP
jgi:hypothetical protein